MSAEEDELPWQVIYIGDPNMVDRLDRGARYHAEHVRQAREGRRLPEPPSRGSTEQRPPSKGEPGFDQSGAGPEDSPAAKAAALGDAALEAGDYAAAAESFRKALAAITSVPNGGWGEAALRCKRASTLRVLTDFAGAEAELRESGSGWGEGWGAGARGGRRYSRHSPRTLLD